MNIVLPESSLCIFSNHLRSYRHSQYKIPFTFLRKYQRIVPFIFIYLHNQIAGHCDPNTINPEPKANHRWSLSQLKSPQNHELVLDQVPAVPECRQPNRVPRDSRTKRRMAVLSRVPWSAGAGSRRTDTRAGWVVRWSVGL